ncbi:hypothetical protein AB0P17_15320 [Streptomyces sp. NPDC088124]|uniref:hypothetical protein n=1 Tax=Streptomyces sp. NPDC088124 TaxID=3154654 RepID=UPI003418B494
MPVPLTVADGVHPYPYEPLALTGHDQAVEATRQAVAAVTADPYSTSQTLSSPGAYTASIYYGEDLDAVRAFATHFGCDEVSTIPVESTEGKTDVTATAMVSGIPVTAWTRVPTRQVDTPASETEAGR